MRHATFAPERAASVPAVALAIPFVLIWTSAFPAAKIGLADSPPLLFLAARFLAAGMLLLAWAAWRGELRGLRLRDVAVLALLGVLNHALYLGLSWIGMGTLSSGLTSIIISANPILVALLSAGLLGEPLTRRKGAGLALGLAGVAFIVRNRLAGGSDPAEGLLLVLGALVTLALGTVLYKRLRVEVGLAAGSGLQTLLAGGMLLPVALALESLADVQLTPGFLVAFAWLVGPVSIGGYLMWFALLERGSASAASAWLFLTPPLALLAGALMLGEAAAPLDFLGIVPVAIGIALVTRDRGPALSQVLPKPGREALTGRPSGRCAPEGRLCTAGPFRRREAMLRETPAPPSPGEDERRLGRPGAALRCSRRAG